MATRVLLADDHQIMREGLRALLEKQENVAVVGEAKDGAEAVTMSRELKPDVVIMDVSMPNMDGIEACRRIAATQPDVKILGLSIHSDRRFVQGMINAGASGFLLKDCAFEQLVGAIKQVLAGGLYLPTL